MESTITLPIRAAVAGVATGLALSVAVIQPFRPAAVQVPEIPKVQACGAEVMDWSLAKVGGCSYRAVGVTTSIAKGSAAFAVFRTRRLANETTDLANSVVASAIETVGKSVRDVQERVESTVDTAVKVTSAATSEVASITANTLETANGAVGSALGTASGVTAEAIEVATETVATSVGVVGGTIEVAEDTVQGLDATVECISSLGLMTLSGNGVVGCSS